GHSCWRSSRSSVDVPVPVYWQWRRRGERLSAEVRGAGLRLLADERSLSREACRLPRSGCGLFHYTSRPAQRQAESGPPSHFVLCAFFHKQAAQPFIAPVFAFRVQCKRRSGNSFLRSQAPTPTQTKHVKWRTCHVEHDPKPTPPTLYLVHTRADAQPASDGRRRVSDGGSGAGRDHPGRRRQRTGAALRAKVADRSDHAARRRLPL